MPKRKSNKSDMETMQKKIARLERSLKTARRRRSRIVSSSDSSTSSGSTSAASSREPSPSPPDPTGGDVEKVPATDDGLDDLITAAARAHDDESALDSALLEILGDDLSAPMEYGKPIHKELALRFEHLATTGLTKEARKEINDKYLVPANCVGIGAPLLNLEIKAALAETNVKRDTAIEYRQKQIASTLSCLAEVISNQLETKSKEQELLKKLMDVGRLLCDIQHTESTARRNLALFSLKKEMKEHLITTKIDKYLFGETLAETLKLAKAVCKTSTDLKLDVKDTKKANHPNENATGSNNLNAKPPAPARRQQGAQQRSNRGPASQRQQRASSSKESSSSQRRSTRRR